MCIPVILRVRQGYVAEKNMRGREELGEMLDGDGRRGVWSRGPAWQYKNGLDASNSNNFINMSETRSIWDHTIHGTLLESRKHEKMMISRDTG